MTLDEYQKAAVSTAVFPPATGVYYCALKLCGEAGEHAEKVAKMHLRGDFNESSPEDRYQAQRAIEAELGDILWYLANLANLYGMSLDQVANDNLVKLKDRKARGVLKGSGDNR